MLEDIKFSVLIPVYNTENYLNQCIESVLEQSYENFEVILVNDGSTDKSREICDEYADQYDFVKVIHQENSGQFTARQNSMKFATGDYCIFLDSDDYWEPHLLEKVKKTIDKYQCDMVIFNRKDVYENTVVEVQLPFHNEQVFSKEKKEDLYKMLLEGTFLNNLVLKVFKRTLSKENIEDYGFKGICYGEDAFKSACLIKEAKKIVYLSECLYNYRRGVGVTSHITADRIEKITYSNSCMLKLLENCAKNFKDYKKRNMCFYLKSVVKYIVWGYINNPQILKNTMKNVCEMPYYRESRKISQEEINFFEKIILCSAEKRKYFVIKLVGEALKIKNRLRRQSY